VRATFGALAAVVAGGLMASCQPNATSPADAFRADAAALQRGKALFVGTCAGYCHSTAATPCRAQSSNHASMCPSVSGVAADPTAASGQQPVAYRMLP